LLLRCRNWQASAPIGCEVKFHTERHRASVKALQVTPAYHKTNRIAIAAFGIEAAEQDANVARRGDHTMPATSLVKVLRLSIRAGLVSKPQKFGAPTKPTEIPGMQPGT